MGPTMHAMRRRDRGGQDDSDGDDDEALEREPHERAGRETPELIRSDERRPHDEQGEDRQARGHASVPAAASRAARGDGEVGAPAGTRRQAPAGRVPAAPQPPRRRGRTTRLSRASAASTATCARAARHDAGRRDRQGDPLRRGNDLAPVPRRQRLAQPRQQPAGGEEHVARRADREHPPAGRAGDVHAENEDQECIDLTVEVRAERGRRPRASHDPAVDRVQRERHGREGDQRRDRRRPAEGVRDQRRDADGERGPGERHPVREPHPLGPVAGEAARQRRIRQHAAGHTDDPSGAVESDGPREGGEQQQLGDQPGQRAGRIRTHSPSGHRAGLNRSHRASAFVALQGSTGDAVIRISAAGAPTTRRPVNCVLRERP